MHKSSLLDRVPSIVVKHSLEACVLVTEPMPVDPGRHDLHHRPERQIREFRNRLYHEAEDGDGDGEEHECRDDPGGGTRVRLLEEDVDLRSELLHPGREDTTLHRLPCRNWRPWPDKFLGCYG